MCGIAFGGGEARIIQRLKEYTRVGVDCRLCRFGEQARVTFHLCFEGCAHLELCQGIGSRADRGQLLQDALTLGSELREREVSERNRRIASRGGGLTFGRGKKNQHLSSVPARRSVVARRSKPARRTVKIVAARGMRIMGWVKRAVRAIARHTCFEESPGSTAQDGG